MADSSNVNQPPIVVDIDTTFFNVPGVNAADNSMMADVLGNKSDTTSGTSLVSLIKGVPAGLLVPAKNAVTNVSARDVIGTKTDDDDGNSIYSQSYRLDKHFHTRSETYPYLAAGILLTGGAGAWALGTKTEIIPTAANDVNTLTVTAGASGNGSVTIALDDINFTVPVVIGNTGSIATQLRAFVYTDPLTGDSYVITGAGNDVIFTRLGRRQIARFVNAGGTGVTASVVQTTPGVGVGDSFDLHSMSPYNANANTTYQIVFWKGLAGFEERISTKRISRVNVNDAMQPVQIMSPRLPASTRVSASIATLSGGSSTILMGVEYHIY